MRVALVMGTYAVCGFLTFGYIYNTKVMVCGMEPSPGKEWLEWHSCWRNHGSWYPPDAWAAGVGWPIYWGARVSIEITK